MKKNNFIALLLSLICAGLLGCGTDTEQSQDPNVSKKEADAMYETNVSINPLIPDEPLPLEERAADLAQLCESTRDGLNRLTEAAKSDTASKKGIKAAQKVEKKYRDRLEELCSMDFSVLTEEEISDLYIEVSTIITAIREASDLL